MNRKHNAMSVDLFVNGHECPFESHEQKIDSNGGAGEISYTGENLAVEQSIVTTDETTIEIMTDDDGFVFDNVTATIRRRHEWDDKTTTTIVWSSEEVSTA